MLGGRQPPLPREAGALTTEMEGPWAVECLLPMQKGRWDAGQCQDLNPASGCAGVSPSDSQRADCAPLALCGERRTRGLHIRRLQRVKNRSHPADGTSCVHLKVCHAFQVFPSSVRPEKMPPRW